MLMKRILSIILVILSLVLLVSCGKKDTTDYSENYNKEVSEEEIYHDPDEDVDYRYYNAGIQYASNKKKDLVPVVYSDEIFFKPATEYHHLLAQQSLGLALSSFNLLFDEDYFSPEELNKGSLYDYLFENGFYNIRIDDYFKETSEYTVGTAIGEKIIEKDEEKSVLFVVAIRGGNYKNEWQSNLDVSCGFRHEGFNNAAQLVTDRVLSYIATQEEVGSFKVWVTGFSRAGAVANLVAANLNKSLLFDENSVYAYTFAAPRAVWGDFYKDANYSNIFNIMNASDFIPQFVPTEWEYRHYGTDIYLPGSEFDSQFDYKYLDVKEPLKTKGITANYNANYNFRIRLLYGILLELVPTDVDFAEILQPVFISILKDKSINNIVNTLRSALLQWKNDYPEFYEGKDEIINYAIEFIPHLILNNDYMKGMSNNLSNPLLQLAHEHFPELYYYSLYSYDKEVLFNRNDEYAYIVLDNNATYYIKDKANGELVYTINKGIKEETQYCDSRHINLDLIKVKNNNVLILPYDMNYEVSYKANKRTTLNIKVVNYGRIFSSKMDSYILNQKVSKGDSGILLEINDGVATYSGEKQEMSAYELAKTLHIDKSLFSYQILVIVVVALIASFIGGILLLIRVLRRKVQNKQLEMPRFFLIFGVALAAVEGEIAYFVLSDYLFITIIFKAIAGACLLLFYYLKIKDKKILKNPFNTILPFIVLMIAGNIVLSFNIFVGLIIFIVGISYLIYYYMRQYRLTKKLWLAYALSTILELLLLVAFIRRFDRTSIVVYVLAVFLLLTVFCASMNAGIQEYATYILIGSFVCLIIYIYRDTYFMYSVLFVLIFNISMLFTADTKKEIEIAPVIEESKIDLV